MGGRGGSSGAGGGGGSISALAAKEKSLSAKMLEYSQKWHTYDKENPDGHREYMPKYFKAKEQWTKAKKKLENARAKQMSKNKKSKESHAFVNSFGEATKRNITSSTYERAMKRTEKDVLRNMGM